MPACAGKYCMKVESLRRRIQELEAALNRGPFPGRATCADISMATAVYFEMEQIDILKKCNAAELCKPRQIAMYLCRKRTKSSLSTIGKHFGGKHHTTVLHSIREIERGRNEVWIAMAIQDIGKSIDAEMIRRKEPCQQP
jgi:chromosomal replication initiation ATPase DnaA